MGNLLAINTGSKTIKFEVFNSDLKSLISGTVDDKDNSFSIRTRKENGISEYDNSAQLRPSENPYQKIKELCSGTEISIVGFRIVHGGEKYINPTELTPEVITELEKLNELAPLHNPPVLYAIKEFKKVFPKIPFIGVFDTAFHKTIKKEQFLYALPYEYYEKYKVRRYGFHGISHKYVSQKLFELEPQARKVISCHLGSGSSITAIVDGNSFDTSMGFTPMEGLVMTTRGGDVDNGAIDYIRRVEKMSPEEMQIMENQKSGLLGISGISFDMRVLLEESSLGNDRAHLAIEIFVYRVKKYIGAYIAAMNGVDGLIFTAGIGAGSDVIRRMIIDGLDFFDLKIDSGLNDGQINVEKPIKISTADSLPIWVIPTDEEYQIAKEISLM